MKKLIIFGFSANPPANHHLAIVQKLLEVFGKVIVVPRGTDSNKPSTVITTPSQRKEMVKLVFSNLPNIEIDPVRSLARAKSASPTEFLDRLKHGQETTPRKDLGEATSNGIDFSDLDGNIFTPTWMIDQKYKAKFPNLEIWHAAGGDLIKDGSEGRSEIQKRWQKGLEIWTNLNWAVIDHLDCPINIQDLPPKNILMKMKQISGRSTTIRNKVAADQPISDLVSPEIERYIKDHNLYKQK